MITATQHLNELKTAGLVEGARPAQGRQEFGTVLSKLLSAAATASPA